MNAEEIMDDICEVEYSNDTDFSRKVDSAYGRGDKLELLNLITEKYNCNFEDAQAVCNCFIDGTPIPNPNPDPQEVARANAEAIKWLNRPKCPTCGSDDVKKISGTARLFSVGILGLASDNVGKTMYCRNCGYKW